MADEIEQEQPEQVNENFQMVGVASTRVKALGWLGNPPRLRAQFPNGKICEYEGVPESVFHAIMSSGSVGANFGAMIVDGGYPFKYV